MRKRIAILCSDDAHHRYLVSLLGTRFHVVAVVIEPARDQRRRLLRTRRYWDFVYSAYHHLRREILGLARYRRRYFAHASATIGDSGRRPVPISPPLMVEWINVPDVIKLLRREKPDVTIVMGTSILRPRVLEVTGRATINIHGGYLPYYRGNHCFFFALYHGEFDRIGSSIHFVNRGIDTGDIIEVVVPPIYPDDNAETLYSRAELLAMHRLVHWLTHVEAGRSLPRQPQSVRGRLYLTRDRQPYHDLLLWWRRATGRLKLPMTVPEGWTMEQCSPPR